jgi:hypothetical protein
VKCPLYARAIDILGAAPHGAATAPCHLPVFQKSVQEPVRESSSGIQFKKHEP